MRSRRYPEVGLSRDFRLEALQSLAGKNSRVETIFDLRPLMAISPPTTRLDEFHNLFRRHEFLPNLEIRLLRENCLRRRSSVVLDVDVVADVLADGMVAK
jgi:hypothetical protein